MAVVIGPVATGNSSIKARLDFSYSRNQSTGAVTCTYNIQFSRTNVYTGDPTNGTFNFTIDGVQSNNTAKVRNATIPNTQNAWTTLATWTETFSYDKTQAITATIGFSTSDATTGYDITAFNVDSVTTSITIPAVQSYIISYDANGGKGAPDSQTKWYDTDLILSNVIPTKSGFKFLGWATSSTATVAEYSAGGTYTANAAATLYAVWERNGNIKVNDNGTWKQGLVWVNDNGIFKRGIAWVNDNGTWKQGI